MKKQNPVTKTDPTKALLDILFFFVVAGLTLFLEKAARSAGFNPLPVAMDGVFSLLISLALVLKLNQFRGFSLKDLGLFRLKKWWMIPAFALLVLVVQLIARIFITPPLAEALGAPTIDLSIYDYLYQNLAWTAATMAGAMFTGGFIEEVLYRGFMIHRLTAVFGGGKAALFAAALLNALPFGLIHYDWGLGGIIFTMVMGAVMGLMYLVTKRNLWPLIMAHAIMDGVLVSTLYFTRGSEVPF